MSSHTELIGGNLIVGWRDIATSPSFSSPSSRKKRGDLFFFTKIQTRLTCMSLDIKTLLSINKYM